MFPGALSLRNGFPIYVVPPVFPVPPLLSPPYGGPCPYRWEALMHSLCRKVLYSLPALLAGPGAVLVLLLLMSTLPIFGAVFIMLVVSAAVTLSVWASEIGRASCRERVCQYV